MAERSIPGLPGSRRLEAWRSWTPDFSSGIAELELEWIVTRFYLEYRAVMLASGVLETMARPEDVEHRRRVRGALAVEAVDIAYQWRRTRGWKSLLAPDLIVVDNLTAVTSALLGSRGASAASQRTGPSWSNRILRARFAMLPMIDPRPTVRLASAAVHLSAHLIVPRADLGRAMLRRLGGQFVMSFLQSAFTIDRLRRQAAEVDSRADRFADQRFAAVCAAEEAAFHSAVVIATPPTLWAIRRALDDGRDRATELAFDEELRLRAWLARRPTMNLGTESPESGALAAETVARLRSRIDLTIRVGGTLQALGTHLRSPRRRTAPARLVTGVLVTRALAAIVLGGDRAAHRLAAPAGQRVQAALDLAAVTAASANQLIERNGAATAWAQTFCHEATAAVGTRDRAGSLTSWTTRGIDAIRIGTVLAERRPGRRLPAAANELISTLGARHLMSSIYDKPLDQAVLLTRTAAALAETRHQAELDAIRLRRQAFVHDGVLQVLRAVATETVPDDRLAAWIDDQLRSLDQAADGLEASTDPIDVALDALASEFAARGLSVDGEVPPFPAWTRAIAATVVEITREALNNSMVHASGRTVHWSFDLDHDKWLTIVIVDVSDRGGDHGGGNGLGTRTMSALAEQIGGSVDWRRTEGGGTEVRPMLMRP